MGGMVNGFVIYIVVMDNGKLIWYGMVVVVDSYIWKGIG